MASAKVGALRFQTSTETVSVDPWNLQANGRITFVAQYCDQSPSVLPIQKARMFRIASVTDAKLQCCVRHTSSFANRG